MWKQNTKPLKKTIILILATLIAATGYEALAQTGNFSSSTGEKNEIKLNPFNKDKGDDRTLFTDVEAWYDSSSMTVTVEGCELKDTFIYIMSPDGLVLAQTSHYFGITPETCTIEVPSLPGKYWLVIDSPALYAEGPFLIN